MTFGEYDDHTLGEIFLVGGKYGSFTRGVLDALARMTSVALQHGVPLQEVIDALKELDFPPQGIVTGSPEVAEALSMPDWLAKELAATYGKNLS